MITITCKDNPLLEDFADASGFYSCPSVALKSFADVLEAYGYRMDYTIHANTLHDSLLVDICDCEDVVCFAHIAWCRYPGGRVSVIGRIVG